MAGSNRRPPRYKHVALPTELSERDAEGGIRTHEAVAVELKSTPFDRSGTSAFEVVLDFFVSLCF